MVFGSTLFAETDLEGDRFRARLSLDAGHIVNGRYYNNETKFLPLNRNIVELEQSLSTDEHWQIDGGIKGILWWPFSIAAKAPHERTLRVEPALSIARARYTLFTNETGRAFADFGFFPYKYNPDAANLGEYLYRSEIYPGVISNTDGLHLLDHARFDAYGLRLHFSHLNNMFHHDLNFFVEEKIIPVGDISPAYEISFTSPFVEFGLGAAFTRLISFAPSKTTPRDLKNAYIVVDSLRDDNTNIEVYRGPSPGASDAIKTAIKTEDTSVYTYDFTHYWTQRGTKIMARLAVNLGYLLPEEIRGERDLRLFAEAAVLGVKNQPYYYEDRNKRRPLMAGINLPTLRFLDILSFQVEHYGSDFNNAKTHNENSLPIWDVNDFENYKPVRRDDWKWSLYAKKNVGKYLKFHLQVANDHLRLPIFNGGPTDTDLVQTPAHWYYVLRLEIGI